MYSQPSGCQAKECVCFCMGGWSLVRLTHAIVCSAAARSLGDLIMVDVIGVRCHRHRGGWIAAVMVKKRQVHTVLNNHVRLTQALSCLVWLLPVPAEGMDGAHGSDRHHTNCKWMLAGSPWPLLSGTEEGIAAAVTLPVPCCTVVQQLVGR